MSDFLPVNTLIPPVPLPENDAVSITVPAPAKLNLFLHVVGDAPTAITSWKAFSLW